MNIHDLNVCKIGAVLSLLYINTSHDVHRFIGLTYAAAEGKYNRRHVSLVGKVPVYLAGGSGSIPGRTNAQGLKIIEEKVLPFL